MNTEAGEDDRSNTRRSADGAPSGRSIVLRDNHLDSRELFVATREITITHGADSYRLRLTSQNKLILTK